MLLLGHRGCRGEFMENTFAAFDHALAGGCDGFEFDVRLTCDGVPIICHDARLRRRSISRETFASLCEHNTTESRARRHPALDLCELESVLARYAQIAWMDIELKVRGVEGKVAELLRRYPPARGFVVSSFHRKVLLELQRIDAALPLGLIFERMPPERVWSSLPVDYLMPNVHLLTPARIGEFHARGKKVLAWTVNQLSTMRALQAAGIDGIIADDPALLAQAR